MERKKLRRQKAILIILSLMLVTPKVASLHRYNPEIAIVEDSEAYASYRGGLVYIGDQEFLSSIRNQVSENDVLILDNRCNDDPNMKVINSCRICSRDEIDDICHILALYETEYPSEWQRSIESMRREWQVHNLFYSFDYSINRTEDVDLNNADEDVYNQLILKYFLS